MSEPSALRPSICIYANCQGGALGMWLARHPALQDCEVVVLEAWNREQPTPSQLARCRLLISQPTWGDPPFVDRLPAAALRMLVPLLSWSLPWPYTFDRPGEPVGWRFPYGDRFLQARIRAGDTPEQAAQAYLALDLPAAVKLDRLAELELQRWRREDERCGTLMALMLEREGREHRLFFTPDHPTDRLLHHLANQVVLRLRLDPLPAPDWATHADAMAGNELPVHPALVRHLQLPGLQPAQAYPIYGGWLRLDAGGYYRTYAQALLAPGLDQGLHQAIQALGQGHTDAALNLCWLIRAQQPLHPGASALLAVVYGMLGKREQAARLLRMAFTLDPREALAEALRVSTGAASAATSTSGVTA